METNKIPGWVKNYDVMRRGRRYLRGLLERHGATEAEVGLMVRELRRRRTPGKCLGLGSLSTQDKDNTCSAHTEPVQTVFPWNERKPL